CTGTTASLSPSRNRFSQDGRGVVGEGELASVGVDPVRNGPARIIVVPGKMGQGRAAPRAAGLVPAVWAGRDQPRPSSRELFAPPVAATYSFARVGGSHLRKAGKPGEIRYD